MKKGEYLNQQDVKDFIEWVKPKIQEEGGFTHQYFNSQTRSNWECNSIYNAFEKYIWKFKCTLPDGGIKSGRTYEESKGVLKKIQDGMASALKNNDHEKLLKYSHSILEWGNVIRSNYNRLQKMGVEILPYYNKAKNALNPNTVDLQDDFSQIFMSSGFTKIYSVLIDDFVIYDSRVGAALGLLVRQYLTEKEIHYIQPELKFAYGNARPNKSDVGPLNRRNPSNETYRFPVLQPDKHHTINNIKANWLLKELSKTPKFNETPDSMRALEASLFMIGYAVN